MGKPGAREGTAFPVTLLPGVALPWRRPATLALAPRPGWRRPTPCPLPVFRIDAAESRREHARRGRRRGRCSVIGQSGVMTANQKGVFGMRACWEKLRKVCSTLPPLRRCGGLGKEKCTRRLSLVADQPKNRTRRIRVGSRAVASARVILTETGERIATLWDLGGTE